MISYFDVALKNWQSQTNLPYRTKNKNINKEKNKHKTDMLRKIKYFSYRRETAQRDI